ncbi:MAG: PVC-type heme-binding CxxCH protein, partial [Pirellulaceae bacterium]
MTSWRIGLALWLWLSGFGVVWAQRDLTNIPDPDPELERQTFLVPDGLEVSLFAADPALAKPIHMNFDERGRLWIASSELYPHIKPGEVANDKILILEDTDLDGRADKTTVFADGLLIPTGVAPGDGGAYVANSTELLHLRDTDGDGRADERRIILSGFGTEDTHHLLHTLRWGFDGCLYMNQSIYIHSHVETPFGVKRLNGGGIWRFRPETMQLDVLCYGFVNSWGHHFDDWGQSFATDGAYHEGINYVFPGAVFVSAPGAKRLVSGLNPGSPKHCGLEIVSGDHFPSDWSGSMITSDFRAHRVCRFVVTEDGSGYASRQETEVIKSTHVAFRPIDAKLGPRGDLFVADWYNPIIQHGEVDFRDPRRDHVHGRIWRVTAKGRPLQPIPDFQGATDAQLLDLLHATQESTRLHAKLTLKQRALQSDSRRQRIINAARQELAQLDRQSATFEHDRLEVLWLLQNVGEVDASLVTECARSADHRVRAAALRVAGEWLPELPDAWELFRAAATDGHPRVRLEAVRGLARFPEPRSASAALAALDQPLDRFLDFALWQTLRDLEPHWLPALTSGKLPWGDRADHWLFALRAIDSPAAVPPLLERIRQNQLPSEYGTQALSLIATHGGPNELATVLSSLFDPAAGRRAESRRSLLEAMVETSRARKVRPSGDLSQLKDLLADGDESLQSAALRAAGAWRVESLRTDAAELATRSTASEPLRRAAIEALAAMGGEPSIRLLMDISASDSALSVRAFAASSLAPLAIQRAAQRGVDLLQHWPGQIDPAPVLGGVLAQRSGPTALVAALKGKKLAPDVAKLAIRAVQTSNQPVPELIESLRLAGDLGASS